MGESTRSASGQKAKPYPEFPLTAHPSGRWCKKHRGKQFYFGPLDDWQAAFDRFNREWPFVIQGKTPPLDDDPSGCTLALLCNAFLNSKRQAVESDELAPRTFHEYHRAIDVLIQQFGKSRLIADLQPIDFEKFRAKLARKYGVVGLRNSINTFRVVFKYAADNRLVDRPVNYGQGFNRPTQKVLRRARNEAGPRLLEPVEIQSILEISDPALRAMVLLGANAGFGNSDVASLPKSALDLEGGWLNFPRVKTEIPRRVPLWTETVEALQEAIRVCPAASHATDGDCVFLTTNGNKWVRVQESKTTGRPIPIDALSQKFSKLLKKLEINGRKRLGFYPLRHVFQAIGGDAKQPDAVAAIMGHVDSSMGAVYRERIADERLQAVVDVVRAWLWPTESKVRR